MEFSQQPTREHQRVKCHIITSRFCGCFVIAGGWYFSRSRDGRGFGPDRRRGSAGNPWIASGSGDGSAGSRGGSAIFRLYELGQFCENTLEKLRHSKNPNPNEHVTKLSQHAFKMSYTVNMQNYHLYSSPFGNIWRLGRSHRFCRRPHRERLPPSLREQTWSLQWKPPLPLADWCPPALDRRLWGE